MLIYKWRIKPFIMLSLLLKHRRTCLLVLCVLLGLACGNLAATLLGMRLNSQPATPAVRAPGGRPAPPADPATELAFILQHHLFDPASRSATPPPFTLREDDGSGGAAAPRASFELIGTIVAGERSIAVLRSGQETKAYRLGATLPGGGKLDEVTRHQVKIRNANQSVTTLAMHEGDRSGAPAAAQPGAAGAPGAAGTVRQTGDNRWVIPRAAAQSVRDNLGEQLRSALMQPRMVDGRTDGFIVQRITPGTLLAQMGLRRGDVIKRVNAMTIDSPEKALQILQQLREARQLNVDLERDGKPLTFAYAIE